MGRAPMQTGARRSWGEDDDGCSILHVDMDAFFASVELSHRPHLRGRPVIVGGSERSVVVAATYEARAFGVHAAMPMTTARRMCPQAVVIPPDMARYRQVSSQVMELLREVTSVVEQASVDEAYLDVAGARRRGGSPVQIAERIRRDVRDRHGITCSVGVARSKYVAKLASTRAKPDGMLLIPRVSTVEFLHSLPVELLSGVGASTRASLARWGIRTVAEVAASDVGTLQRAVGRTAGAHLYDLAWGRDSSPVRPVREEKSIGNETTFAQDVADLAIIEAQARVLADQTASRLRASGTVARTVVVKVRTSDFTTMSRSRTLVAPTDVGHEIFLVARELIAGVDRRGLPVRLVGVRVEGLSPAASTPRQLSFDGLGEETRRAERAMDDVRERFGSAALRPASAASLERPGRTRRAV